MLTLQINDRGSWRSLTQIEEARREQVLAGVAVLADVLGPGTKWCLVDENGQREWLAGLRMWRPVSATAPKPLEDVMVTAWDACDEEPQVYMAWRSNTQPGRWMLSGSDEVLSFAVYAWAPVPAAAPFAAPADAQEVAA